MEKYNQDVTILKEEYQKAEKTQYNFKFLESEEFSSAF